MNEKEKETQSPQKTSTQIMEHIQNPNTKTEEMSGLRQNCKDAKRQKSLYIY
jgi:hypothetical protein